MLSGTQLVAPDGWRALSKSEKYYFLASTPDPHRVLLVNFRGSQKKDDEINFTAAIISIARGQFEEALSKGIIEIKQTQSHLPPWLKIYENKDLTKIIDEDVNKGRIIQSRVKDFERVKVEFTRIITSRNPQAEINKIAMSLGKNIGRFRRQACAYMLFGFNRNVLITQTFNCGRYQRDNLADTKKLGRPSNVHGKNYGTRMTKIEKNKIIEGYNEHKGLGVNRRKIYELVCKGEFNCKPKTNNKWSSLYQPEGHPFPTFNQFEYLLKEVIGLEQLQIDRYGVARHEQLNKGNYGSFSEKGTNVLQRFEADGYWSEYRPVNLLGEELSAVVVVTLRDSVSGVKTGIGFSLAGETLEAYRMAYFCAAIDKVEFCALFGITIFPHQWPCRGIAPINIKDRGVGSTESEMVSAFEEMTVAYKGRGKASAETAHRKPDKIQGGPVHKKGKLNLFEVCQQEILSLLVFNEITEVKLTPEMLIAGIPPCPNAKYAYLDERGRNSGMNIDKMSAITKYLVKAQVTCNGDGIYYHGQLYKSPELYKRGILDIAAKRTISLGVHFCPMAVRRLWVSWKDELIEVNASLPFDDDEKQLDISLPQLMELESADKKSRSRFKEHKIAARMALNDQLKENTGKSIDVGKVTSGKHKKLSQKLKKETKAIKSVNENQ